MKILDDFFAEVSRNYTLGRRKGSFCRKLDLVRNEIPESDDEVESYEAKYRDLKNEYHTTNRPEGIVNRFAFSLGEVIGYDLLEK